MDKIRLGNDIEMRWSIFTRDGDNKVPYDLEGRELTLSVVNRTGESEIEFFAKGNIVTGVFRGRDQKILGKHGVILRENNGRDGMRTVDACDAFELVACSCEEALGSPGTIQLFHLTFDTTIGAITGTIDPILNHEAEQAEAERKASEIIRKIHEEARQEAEAARQKASAEAVASANAAAENAQQKAEEAASSAASANSAASTANEAAGAANAAAEAADTAAGRANEAADKFNAAIVQETGDSQDKVMSQKVVTDIKDALEASIAKKQAKLTAGRGINISGSVISSTLDTNPFVVVSSLPATGNSEKIYLVPAEKQEEGNLTDEWIWNNGQWERLGSAKVDLTPYAKDEEVKAALLLKVDKVTGKGLSSNDYTDADKLKLTGLENYDDTQVRELIAGKQDTLTAGENITIENNVISSKGGSIYPPDMNDDFNNDFAN